VHNNFNTEIFINLKILMEMIMKIKRGSLSRGEFLIIFAALIVFAFVIFYFWIGQTVIIVGKATQRPFNVSVSVAGSDPAIIYVSPISPVNPEESEAVDVTFYVQMYDADGVDDLDHNSVAANFSKGGVIRQNDSCVHIGNIDGYSANYSCTITMWYWDSAGEWNIIVRGRDFGSGSWSSNVTETFSYTELKSIIIDPLAISWAAVSPGASNQVADDHPIVIDNTGNYVGSYNLLAINLIGDEDSGFFMPSANFSSRNVTGAAAECSGTTLQNATSVEISDSYSNPGNLSAGQGQESLYFCIVEVPMIKSQAYTTTAGGSWHIQIED
jgi:hypothetical protein